LGTRRENFETFFAASPERADMKSQSSSSAAFSLAAVLVLSACAMKEPPPSVMYYPLSAEPAAPPPAAASAPAVSTAPSTPAIETTIIPGSLRDFEVNVGDRVFFAFDQSSLDERAQGVLKKQATWLQRYRAVSVTLQGNCDERGTREYNLALGARRAQAAKDYLVSLGVVADRLKTISFGKERPICAESNETCWAQNRRTMSAISGAVPSTSVAMQF